MSLYFNDTTKKKGIIQSIERKVLNYGDISSNTEKLKHWTAEVNIAADEVWAKIFQSAGTFQADDINHTDYPELTLNLVSGQRDYFFTTDERGNLILDIYKVFVAQEDNVGGNVLYNEIYPVDSDRDPGTSDFYDGLDTTGTPYRYNKTGRGIFLDAVPGYSKTNGIKVLFSRESLYFTYTDTTNKPGFDGLFHELLALIPATKYAEDNNLQNATKLRGRTDKMMKELEIYYSHRDRQQRRPIRHQSKGFV